jgi:hypothetical protein
MAAMAVAKKKRECGSGHRKRTETFVSSKYLIQAL